MRALKQDKEFPKNLVDLSSDWYWEQDEHHRFTKIEGGAFAKGGFEAEEYLGTTRWDGGARPVGDGGSWDSHKAALKTRRPFTDFLFRRPTSAGAVRYISTSGQPVYDGAGRFRGYRGLARDVTERIQTERRLTIEHGVTHVLAESNSIAEAAPRIIRLMCETLDWSCGTRWELDGPSETFRCLETWGIGPDAIDKFLAATKQLPPQTADGGGLIRATWTKGEPHWIRDVTREATFVRGPAAARAGLRSAFAFPIKVAARVIGVMEFFSQEIHQPDAELLNATHYIGSQIGQFMQRKQAEEILRESEERFRGLTELSSDWYWEQDENLRFTQFSGRGLSAARIDTADWLGKTRWEMSGLVFDAEARAALEAKVEAREPYYDFEYKRVEPNGSVLCIATSGTPVFDAAGRFTGYRGIAKDVTARRRGEQLLALEHMVNRRLADADNVPAALEAVLRAVCETQNWGCGRYFGADGKADVLRFSGAWGVPDAAVQAFLRESRDISYAPGVGLIGKVWQSAEPLWVPDIAKDNRVRKGIARSAGLHGAFFFAAASGGKAIGVLAFHSHEVREPDDRLLQTVRVIGSQIGQFVQRKQAEAVLRESEARFRSVIDSANEGILVYDRALQVIGGNAAAERIIGLPLADIIGANGFTSLLPCLREDGSPFRPEDRPTRNTVRLGKPLTGQIIGIRRPDGSVTWLSVNTGFLRRAGESDHYGVVSTFGDITAQRQAEAAVRESEARFRSLTDLSSDWFWEQDERFRFSRLEGTHITGDNSAFKSELGKTREEIGVEVDGGWDAHRALLEARRPFRDVLMWRTWPGGQRHYMSLSGEPIFDRAGRFFGYRGVGRDVTVRKRAEQLMALEHTVTRRLAEADSVSGALQTVIRAICESENWECGRYFAVDETAGELRVVEDWGIPDPVVAGYLAASRERAFPLDRGIKGRARREREPVWSSDASRQARLAQTHFGNAGAAFAFPVISEDKVIAVLSFTSRELRTTDARLLQAVRVIGSQIGQFVQRKRTEQASLRLTRMFAALSGTNDAILHAKSIEELYQQVCAAAVHDGKFSNISIFLAEPGASRMRAVAAAGKVPEQLLASHNSIDDTIAEGRGLVGIAFRTQRPCVSNDFLNDERTLPWQELGRNAGCRSAAALPLVQGGRSIGAVLIHDDEVDAFDEEIVQLLERLAENVSFALDNFEHEAERKQAQERIQYLATHDGLTGLPNRVMFSQMLNLAIQSARRYDRHFAVLFLDLDRFKIINDTLGHEAGDTLLQETAKRIKENLRASDVVARLGGDEFVVLLQEVNEAEHVTTVARKLLSTVIRPVVILGQECRVTASIGICMYPTDAQDEQSLMKNADVAMYLAKEEGKNNFQFYSKNIKSQSLERLMLEMSLRHALERQEFSLEYQAKLDLTTGAITGVEALLRWKHPEHGSISPAQFIPLAEETGLIVPIGKWVLRTACAQNVAWQNAGLPPVCMAVNLSPRQFADENLLSDLAGVLRETAMPAELLELEITESMVMGNVERAARQLAAIKGMGIRLAIDDFGTGYSSLAQIKRFPIDTIKVDRSFIREIPQDAEDNAITQAIIAMGKSLSLTVVAEGVETQAQQKFLRAHACHEMQGYYFSRPIAPEQFAELLRNHVADAVLN